MRGKLYATVILLMLLLSVTACSGLRFSQLDPAAKDYHPRRIAVFPSDVGTYDEARMHVDQIIPGVLAEKKWLDDVIGTADLNRQLSANDELQKAMTDYLSKLKTLNFSDPALSKQIGNLTKTDAFLMVTVDYWNYTTEKDKKLARVGMGMKLIDAQSGKIMWRAGHHREESYILLKPELAKVARSLASDMLNYMPR
ncbi:MAG: hypothetical protein R6W75_11550 [Smithellaceae bacterium]